VFGSRTSNLTQSGTHTHTHTHTHTVSIACDGDKRMIDSREPLVGKGLKFDRRKAEVFVYDFEVNDRGIVSAERIMKTQ